MSLFVTTVDSLSIFLQPWIIFLNKIEFSEFSSLNEKLSTEYSLYGLVSTINEPNKDSSSNANIVPNGMVL